MGCCSDVLSTGVAAANECPANASSSKLRSIMGEGYMQVVQQSDWALQWEARFVKGDALAGSSTSTCLAIAHSYRGRLRGAGIQKSEHYAKPVQPSEE